ncbi:EAL domain-containing protein [Rhodovibrio salinarum]|uniref:EAL domain-containing protein n=1 Tax=Rhodovibrio salinarum TaxID=1087 RepID=A0A934QL27_9PROT|nr:EAL domain-containing protein [Rhodovibrio salinarum]MBK1698898.1 EAL domain-containing protein [Rhodovibrio salinarum]
MACSSTGCARCERLPARPDAPSTLYLWPPLGHSAGKIRKRLDSEGIPFETAGDDDGLILQVETDAVRQALIGLEEVLSAEECRAARTLALTPGATPTLADYPRVTTLETLLNYLRAGPLIDTLAHDAFEIGFAPIVFADDHSDVMAHGAQVGFPRLSGESDAVFELARRADLLHQLDRSARIACIKAAPAQNINTPVFVEFQPAAIYDPVYCLRTTVEAAKRVDLPPENIVFTLNHPQGGYDVAHLKNILSYYRDQGYEVALGRLGSGVGALELLQHLRPGYAWLAPQLIDGIADDPYRGVIARKLLEMAHRLRIETIASTAPDSPEASWLYEHGVNYLAISPHPSARTAPIAERHEQAVQ